MVAGDSHEDDARLHHARRDIAPATSVPPDELSVSVRAADAIVINSESLRSQIQGYLEVDQGKLKLVYEAVDHGLFRPGNADAARATSAAATA